MIESKNNKTPAPLVLRIGVTGHRTEPDDLSANQRKRHVPDIPAIRATIREVLDEIRVVFKQMASVNGDMLVPTTTRNSQPVEGTLNLISSLASGADQWVADEAVKLGFELHAFLPFERDEYLKDFTDEADARSYLYLLSRSTTIIELEGKVGIDKTGNRKPDSRSYEAVGRGIINLTDLLIAIWDGNDAQGPGGTGQIVRGALQNGIPVVWIPWSTPEKWLLGQPPLNVNEKTVGVFGDNDRLSDIIRKILLPLNEDHHEVKSEYVPELTQRVLDEWKNGKIICRIWTFPKEEDDIRII